MIVEETMIVKETIILNKALVRKDCSGLGMLVG
jgi:hypothetical protein